MRRRADHGGSHPHLVHEFLSSIIEQRPSAINAETAASWTAPGVCAHLSALTTVNTSQYRHSAPPHKRCPDRIRSTAFTQRDAPWLASVPCMPGGRRTAARPFLVADAQLGAASAPADDEMPKPTSPTVEPRDHAADIPLAISSRQTRGTCRSLPIMKKVVRHGPLQRRQGHRIGERPEGVRRWGPTLEFAVPRREGTEPDPRPAPSPQRFVGPAAQVAPGRLRRAGRVGVA